MMGYYGYGHGMMGYGNYYGNGYGMMGNGGYGYNMMSNGGGWIMMLGIIILFSIAVFAFVKYMQRTHHLSPVTEGNLSVEILNKRYARGEITDEEYKMKKNEIKR